MTRYTVTLRFRFPAWDEKDGIPYEVEAASKSDAIKQVRRQAYNDGHTVGRSVTDARFTAVESDIRKIVVDPKVFDAAHGLRPLDEES